MIKYKKIFLDFWDYAPGEFIPCTNCGANSVDLHHLIFKSHGGKDTVENLAPVCRECHNIAHDHKEFNEILKLKHAYNIKRFAQNKP